MSEITLDRLLENGVHYGHRASRWNPKMKRYIHGKRNAIHIINLEQTVRGLVRAEGFLQGVTAQGGKVLWVGTKRSAKEAVRSIARRTKMPFVTERWLGGTLTNFRTIRSRLARLQELEELDSSGVMSGYKKKEQARMRNEPEEAAQEPRGHPRSRQAARLSRRRRSEERAHRRCRSQQDAHPRDRDPRHRTAIPTSSICRFPATTTRCVPSRPCSTCSLRASRKAGAPGAVVEAEHKRAEEAARAEEEQRREQMRQRAKVTEEWQRRLREDQTDGDEPKAEEPKADEPKAEEPKADEAKADDAKADDAAAETAGEAKADA